MTLFEYLAIAFGLLFSVAALRLIGGLPHAIDRHRRYWVHLALLLMALQGIVGTFWFFWTLRDVDWTYRGFSLALAMPAALYFSVAMLIPENPEQVESWEAHYYASRTRFFAGWLSFGIAAAASMSVNLGVPLVHRARVAQIIIIALGVLGLISPNRRVHAVIAILGIATAVFAVVTADFVVGELLG